MSAWMMCEDLAGWRAEPLTCDIIISHMRIGKDFEVVIIAVVMIAVVVELHQMTVSMSTTLTVISPTQYTLVTLLTLLPADVTYEVLRYNGTPVVYSI